MNIALAALQLPIRAAAGRIQKQDNQNWLWTALCECEAAHRAGVHAPLGDPHFSDPIFSVSILARASLLSGPPLQYHMPQSHQELHVIPTQDSQSHQWQPSQSQLHEQEALFLSYDFPSYSQRLALQQQKQQVWLQRPAGPRDLQEMQNVLMNELERLEEAAPQPAPALAAVAAPRADVTRDSA